MKTITNSCQCLWVKCSRIKSILNLMNIIHDFSHQSKCKLHVYVISLMKARSLVHHTCRNHSYERSLEV